MNSYTYIAKNMMGKTVRGFFQAEGETELLEKIAGNNLFCISFSEARGDVLKARHKFSLKELAFLCRQLSAMLNSGLTLVKALDILQKEQSKKGAQQTMLDIYEDVQKGKLLSESMQMQNGAFPSFLISMVGAGEASGTLDTVMTRMSDHYAKENKLQNKIRGALTYPIILLVLSVVVVIGLFTFIMPTFIDMFKGSDIPPLTQAMMAVSDFIRTKWYVLIIAVIVVAVVVYFSLKIPSVRVAFDQMKLKYPIFGKLIAKVYTGRFARTLSALYSSGIPMIECIEKSVAVLGNTYIDFKFETVIESVKQGKALSAAILKTGIFDSMFCSIIYVGEEAGSLDEILVKSSEYYEEESDSAIQKMVTMIEPMMIIFLGVIVGLVIASILPAMYSMYQNVQ